MMKSIVPLKKVYSDASAISRTSAGSDRSIDNPLSPPVYGIAITTSDLQANVTSANTLESSGRLKAPPVCLSEELKGLSMTSSQLQELVFSSGVNVKSILNDSSSNALRPLKVFDTSAISVITNNTLREAVIPTSVSILGSSCGASLGSLSRDCDVATLSDTETKLTCGNVQLRNKAESKELNAKVMQLKDSRQGRASQRWESSNETALGEPVRLVVGTVPILRGGKILFVSASRKAEWILPKGGWEDDESMEESAIRECFEEAGVVGTIGKPLTPVQYETRKSKKRRIEVEESKCPSLNKADEDVFAVGTASSDSGRSRSLDEDRSLLHQGSDLPHEVTDSSLTNHNYVPSLLSPEAIARIRNTYQAGSKQTDETMSNGSTFSSSYSFVKMTLFPLYVTDVMSVWPESGRFRTVVDIDEAIKMMESRPEFKVVLQEVKSLGLHLVENPSSHV